MATKRFNIRLPDNDAQQRMDILDYQSSILTSMYEKLCTSSELSSLNYRVKQVGPNKGQFGYYVSDKSGSLHYLLTELKSNSLLDLGSGAGILLFLLQRQGNIRVRGYEIESSLIEIANKLLPGFTIQKDILTLKVEDIQNFDTLYFWEPLADKELAKKFIDNLLSILLPKQVIIYKPSGYIRQCLEKSKKLVSIQFRGLILYKLK